MAWTRDEMAARAAKELQKLVGVAADGVVGAKTVAAVLAVSLLIVLHELGHLDGQSHRQVLRGVVAAPAPLLGEATDPLGPRLALHDLQPTTSVACWRRSQAGGADRWSLPAGCCSPSAARSWVGDGPPHGTEPPRSARGAPRHRPARNLRPPMSPPRSRLGPWQR